MSDSPQDGMNREFDEDHLDAIASADRARLLILAYAEQVQELVKAFTSEALEDSSAALDLRAAGVLGLCTAATTWSADLDGPDFWAFAGPLVEAEIGAFLERAHGGHTETDLALA